MKKKTTNLLRDGLLTYIKKKYRRIADF